MTLSGGLTPVGSLSGRLSGNSVVYGVIRQSNDTPYYTGEYEATPNTEIQIFDTQGYRMSQNFTVNPIPNNYGLISWNGFELTVS